MANKTTTRSTSTSWPTLTELITALGEDRAAIEAGAREAIQVVLAHELAEVRRATGITQMQLASAIGVDQSRISRIERGDLSRIEVGSLASYARALGGDLELIVRIGDVAVRLGERSGAARRTVRKPAARGPRARVKR
ncbi:MAG: helix-turn-helix domain-containing protein [Candidatus Nanopelagicales bacterium]